MIKNNTVIKIITLLIAMFVISCVVYFIYLTKSTVGVKLINTNQVKEISKECNTDEQPTADDYIPNEKLEKLLNKDFPSISKDLTNFICPETIQCSTCANVKLSDFNGDDSGKWSGCLINGKSFSSKKVCSVADDIICSDVNNISDAINKEIKQNSYNIVDGCLYNKKERVLKYNLLAYAEAGFFGDKYSKINKEPRRGLGESAQEWFRFKHDNKLYIFLYGGAGCGGCIFNGPYFEIDLITNKIEGKSANIPYFPNIFLSPSKKIAIEVASSEINGRTSLKELYVYDFIKMKRGDLIYKVPENKSISFVGDGEYPIRESIIWLNEQMIQIQLYNTSNDSGAESIYDEEKNTQQFIKSGNPIIINIQNE